MVKKELWLQNSSGVDVNLSDVGVKVGANKTVNVFAYNPYLTEEKVRLSLKEGAIYKRLKAGTLKMVKGKPGDKESPIKVSQDTKPISVVKTKSSVVIESTPLDVMEGDGLDGIADYGLGELDNFKVTSSNGMVSVEQKQDQLLEEKSDAEPDLKTIEGKNVSGQSVVVMTKQVECQRDPTGDLVGSSTKDQPFYVVESKSDALPEKPVEVTETQVFKESESVVVKPEQKAEVPKDEISGMRVASKTKSGVVTMKVKE